MDKEEYIKKWLDHSLTEDEKVAFEKSGDFEALLKMDAALKSFRAPEYNTDEQWMHLKNARQKTGKVVSISWMQTIVRVAAVLLVIMSGYFFFYLNVNTSTRTVATEKQELFLPDASRVVLNAQSQLAYKKNMWKYKREVLLEGEAFFDVASGSKFEVHTSDGIVSVLGTEFNVKNRDKYFEVICYEGMVQVESATQSIKLSPKEAFRVVNGQIEKYEIKSESTPGWLTNRSSFTSVPFGQVLQEFERQFDAKVLVEDINMEQLFTGSFSHDDMKLALESIATPLNIDYEINSDKEILLSR